MRSEWICKRGFALLLAVCLLALCAGEVGARGPTIRDIQPYDTIFIYEEGLNLSGLRNATTNNPITALRKYQDDNPDKSLVKNIPIAGDTDFEVQDFLVHGDYGTYYAYSPVDGATAPVFIREPEIFLDVVLGNPYHNEPLTGLTVSENTRIAFRIASPDVGAFYQAGGAYPATVDIVLTHPGGAESTLISGLSFAGLNVSSTRFYTDDPGRPGAIVLSGLGRPGTYSVRAVWRTPEGFDARARDSAPVMFTVGNRVGVNTTATPTPGVTTTPTTTPPATAITPTVTTTATSVPTVTATGTGTTVSTTSLPTATPLPVAVIIGALAIAIVAGRRR